MKKGATALIIVGLIIIAGGIYSVTRKHSVSTQPAAVADSQMPTNQQPMGMQPSSPKPLTDTQNAQLAAGVAAHAPTTLNFDLNTGSFYYSPNVIHVKKGDTVNLTITNDGGMHNFKLDEFNIKTDIIPSGKSVTVSFVADKTGTFEFYCGVGQHRQMGQKGTLIVE